MNNILVTGSNGQLGSEINALTEFFSSFRFFFTDATTLDITNYKRIKKFIEENNIKIIINCAAYTKVDAAESNENLAKAVNHLAVANLSKIAKEKKIKLIHISTDYVFDGINRNPYVETDIPNPRSVYGKTKLDGELAMQKINPANSIIIRTSWVYSKFGTNFVKTMLRLAKIKNEIAVVSDQFGSPTNASNLAQTILSIIPKIKNETVEIYHYTNEGTCTWFDFAIEIFSLNNIDVIVKPIKTEDYPTSAIRPKYSNLNFDKICKTFNIGKIDWRTSLKKSTQDF